jgi:hypothetical protein
VESGRSGLETNWGIKTVLGTRRIDFWNGFHDSQLTRITELMPGQFEVEIACSHLAPRFESGSRSLIVQLDDCWQCWFEGDGQHVPVADELQKSEIDIILASDDGDVVNLDGIHGRVTLAYAESRLLAPSGRYIALAEWEDGWIRYWHQLLYNGTRPVAVTPSPPHSTPLPGGDAESQRWSQLTQVWINTTRVRMLAE